jgi:hypothetical protein
LQTSLKTKEDLKFKVVMRDNKLEKENLFTLKEIDSLLENKNRDKSSKSIQKNHNFIFFKDQAFSKKIVHQPNNKQLLINRGDVEPNFEDFLNEIPEKIPQKNPKLNTKNIDYGDQNFQEKKLIETQKDVKNKFLECKNPNNDPIEKMFIESKDNKNEKFSISNNLSNQLKNRLETKNNLLQKQDVEKRTINLEDFENEKDSSFRQFSKKPQENVFTQKFEEKERSFVEKERSFLGLDKKMEHVTQKTVNIKIKFKYLN